MVCWHVYWWSQSRGDQGPKSGWFIYIYVYIYIYIERERERERQREREREREREIDNGVDRLLPSSEEQWKSAMYLLYLPRIERERQNSHYRPWNQPCEITYCISCKSWSSLCLWICKRALYLRKKTVYPSKRALYLFLHAMKCEWKERCCTTCFFLILHMCHVTHPYIWLDSLICVSTTHA